MKNRNFVIALLYPMLMAVLAMGCGTSSAEPVSSNIPITATSVVVAKTTSMPLEELIEEGDYQFESGAQDVMEQTLEVCPISEKTSLRVLL